VGGRRQTGTSVESPKRFNQNDEIDQRVGGDEEQKKSDGSEQKKNQWIEKDKQTGQAIDGPGIDR
jgi:hypothetical protein